MPRRTLALLSTLAIAAGVAVGVMSRPTVGSAPVSSAAAATAAATFEIDPIHSCGLFRVLHLGAGNFYGRFNQVEGSFTLDESGEENPSFNVTIAIESVDTNNASLDGHLKSPDFFNAKEKPTMSFKSVSVKPKDKGTYAVTGDLTIKSTTKRVTVDMKLIGTADFGRGYRAGFETSFTIKRSDFGVNYGIANGMLGDETLIIVSMEGVRKDG